MSGNIFNHNWLVHRIVRQKLVLCAKECAGGTLLDIGCGDKPYESMLTAYVDKYIGLDTEYTLHDKSKADLIGDAYKIPMGDQTADTILCTAVLEHLEEPARALKEAHRVLKPGGYAIYTAPLFWHLHEEPRDFFRYTKHGLAYLFDKAGFEVIKIEPLSGFWVTFGQELVYYLWRFRRGGKLNPLWWMIPPIGALVQAACYAMNHLDHSHQFTWMFLVVARKREAPDKMGRP